MIRELVRNELKETIKKTLGPDFSDFEIEHPQNDRFGDFTLNVALKASKLLKQTPMEIARLIKDRIEKDSELFKEIEIVRPGFINLTIKSDYLVEELKEILEKGDSYGRGEALSDKTIMIEFAHPNTHKEFHIGHLRNISLGESLVRLQEAMGAKVIRANYQGDVGLHVAKALWGLLKKSNLKDQILRTEELPLLERVKLLGRAYVEGNKAYEGEYKDEVVETNKKIYRQDASVFKLWQKTRRWSLEYFDSLYERLGSRFDRFYFESEVAGPGIKKARQALKEGILEESAGAVIFDGAPFGLDKRVFLTAEGLPTYEAKELGLADLEFSEFGQIARCLHVVGPEQQSFFAVTFKVEEMIDREKFAGKQEHYVYGYVQLKEGKMSSRRGNVVTAVSVIEKAKAEIKKLIKTEGLTVGEVEEIAEKTGLGAVKYSMLRPCARNDIAFDLEESIALEGNSGPYLQYTYARARSVLRKAENSELRGQNLGKNLELEESDEVLSSNIGLKFSVPTSDFQAEESVLLRTLYKFPEVVEAAAFKYAPHLLCNYLYDLAQKFNLFYNNVPILERNKEVRIKSQGKKNDDLDSKFLTLNSNFRPALTAATAQVIRNGLYLLGIKIVERM